MKVLIHGPLSARDHLGQMVGFAPDQLVELDDDDEAQVAWGRGWAATPHGTLVEDVKAKPKPEPKAEAKEEKAPAKQPPPPPAKEPAKAAHPAGKSSGK